MNPYFTITSILQHVAWVPTRMAFAFFLSFSVCGQQHLLDESNVIIASNHLSELDPILVTAALPFFSRHLPLFYVSREKSFYSRSGFKKVFYGGTLFEIWGAYKAYTGTMDYDKALKHHIQLLGEGKSVCIFPTGKKVSRHQDQDVKGGVSFLAHRTEVPILPVTIEGAEGITFIGFLLRKHKVTVTFHKPLYKEDLFEAQVEVTPRDTQRIYEGVSRKVMNTIISA